jgi:hypothetical protein
MDTSRILVKTSKGVEEVKHRSFGLPLGTRGLLIMVDGVTTIGHLLGNSAQAAKNEEALNWLINEGFVEPATSGAQSTGKSAPAPLTAAGGKGSGKQELITMAQDLLGDDAAKVIARLEDVQDSRAELLAAVDRCHKFIKLTIDEKKAGLFLKAGQAMLAEMR